MPPPTSYSRSWPSITPRAPGIIGAAIAVALLLVVGCSSDGVKSPTGTGSVELVAGQRLDAFASIFISKPVSRQLSRVDLIPRFPVLPAGETAALLVVAYDDAGNALDPTQLEVRWRMKDPQAGFITTTGIFRSGFQRGVFTNAIEVTVTQEMAGRLVTLQKLVSVSVIRSLSDLDITRILVLPDAIQVAPGRRLNLLALALDRGGVMVPDAELFWEMLDAEAGVIGKDGRFTSGSTEGSYPAAIRVIARKPETPDQTAMATVSVEIRSLDALDAPSKLALYPQAVSLRPGDTVGFRALALDLRGNLYQEVETSWTLLDPNAGTLDPSGQFLAGTTPGTYPNLIEVTVTAGGVGTPIPLKATATVTVLEPFVALARIQQLLVTPVVIRLEPDESQRLTATVLSRSRGIVTSADVKWAGQAGVVDVTDEGVVTAIGAPGTYLEAVTVKVTAGEGADQVTQTATAAVIILGPLARVEVFPPSAQLGPNQLSWFTFLAYDTNDVRLFNLTASWEVLDEGAGTITKGGLFTAGESQGEYAQVIRVIVTVERPRAGGG